MTPIDLSTKTGQPHLYNRQKKTNTLMAGIIQGVFKELISPFLAKKIDEALIAYGRDSIEYQALVHQYVKTELEDLQLPGDRERHYNSELTILQGDDPLVGVERLYRRTLLVEPSTACAAHCRWCLRGLYPSAIMQNKDIENAAKYAGSEKVKEDINEVLVTGGDPLVSPEQLRYVVEQFSHHAPNVKILRIGTRMPFHNPEKINKSLLSVFEDYHHLRFEIGINVNHPIEFWPESINAIHLLLNTGVTIYSQHPLLKGVNDNLNTLLRLYALFRDHSIEPHYLFHAIPMKGTNHHRTTLSEGLELANRLCSSGDFSGRAKPKFAVLSDIGKIVIYHDTVLKYRETDNCYLLKSGYRYEDRISWNPTWKLPDSSFVGEDGYLCTWYQDKIVK